MDHQQLTRRVVLLEAEITRLREKRIPHVDRASRRRDQRLGGALVVATALALGLAGLASAAALPGSGTVFADDLVADAVTSPKIADGAVSGTDVKDEAIGGTDIKDASIGAADIKDASIGGADIKDASIGAADVFDGTIWGEDLNLFNDNLCTGETVQGTAAVNADPAVPATYTTSWLGWTHSCAGQAVQVRRERKGVYFVKFGGPMRLAAVTVSDTAAVVVQNVGPGEFKISVEFHGYDNIWSPSDDFSLADLDFSVLAY